MELNINGSHIVDKRTLLIEIKKQMNLEDFYGNNFDALYDVLSNYQHLITITIKHEEILSKNLGNDYIIFMNIIKDLIRRGHNIVLKKA